MLIQADASQLEWRVLAWLANDKVALEEINKGLDFHSLNQETFGLPSRIIAKVYLFRTIYRGSGWSFAKDPDFSVVSDDPNFWDDINQKFYKKYKGIDKCHKLWAETCASRKPIVSPIGGEWLVLPKEDGKLPWTIFTNYPVQGTGAHLMMVARISLYNRMKKLCLTSKLVSTVHDSIVMDSPKNEVETVSRLAIQVFDDIPANIKQLFKVELPCAFPGEVKVGYNLRDTMKLDKYLEKV